MLEAKAEAGSHEPLGKEIAGVWGGGGEREPKRLSKKLKNCTMINPIYFRFQICREGSKTKGTE